MTQREKDIQRRNLRAHLRLLTAQVDLFLVEIDQAMQGTSTPDRGKRIAQLCNRLNLTNDIAWRFGLKEKKKQAVKSPQ